VEYYLRTTWGKYMGTWEHYWEFFIYSLLLVGAWWEQIEKILGTIWEHIGNFRIFKNKTLKKKPFGVGWGGYICVR
jgi:hypothetical protein